MKLFKQKPSETSLQIVLLQISLLLFVALSSLQSAKAESNVANGGGCSGECGSSAGSAGRGVGNGDGNAPSVNSGRRAFAASAVMFKTKDARALLDKEIEYKNQTAALTPQRTIDNINNQINGLISPEGRIPARQKAIAETIANQDRGIPSGYQPASQNASARFGLFGARAAPQTAGFSQMKQAIGQALQPVTSSIARAKTATDGLTFSEKVLKIAERPEVGVPLIAGQVTEDLLRLPVNVLGKLADDLSAKLECFAGSGNAQLCNGRGGAPGNPQLWDDTWSEIVYGEAKPYQSAELGMDLITVGLATLPVGGPAAELGTAIKETGEKVASSLGRSIAKAEARFAEAGFSPALAGQVGGELKASADVIKGGFENGASIAGSVTKTAQEVGPKFLEVLNTPKGLRPSPESYLTREYIDAHLAKFDQGASRFMGKEQFELFGPAQVDGTSFVMPRADADRLLSASNGDSSILAKSLGLPESQLNNGLVRIDIASPRSVSIRLPSGNEAGANQFWLPGGKLPDGSPEAVIDLGRAPASSWSVHIIE